MKKKVTVMSMAMKSKTDADGAQSAVKFKKKSMPLMTGPGGKKFEERNNNVEDVNLQDLDNAQNQNENTGTGDFVSAQQGLSSSEKRKSRNTVLRDAKAGKMKSSPTAKKGKTKSTLGLSPAKEGDAELA